MKKRLYLLLVILSILIITSCSKDDNLSKNGDNKAIEYFNNFYNADIGNIKVDFIGHDDFIRLKKQDNNFIVLASDISCEFCRDFVPKFFDLAKDYKIDHIYFLKFNEMEQKEKNEVAKSFTESIIPTILFFKNGNIDEFQGQFDIRQMSLKIENYKKD